MKSCVNNQVTYQRHNINLLSIISKANELYHSSVSLSFILVSYYKNKCDATYGDKDFKIHSMSILK